MSDSKPNALAPLDASWDEMSEDELRRQADRQQRREELPPPDDEVTIDLAEARKRLAAKTQKLATASDKEMPVLAVEIQKLRVMCMLLSEAGEPADEHGRFNPNPNTYREMGMLNRMLANVGPGEEDDPSQAADDLIAEESAADRLTKRGISRTSIPQMIRVLSALGGRMPVQTPEDDEGDEPEMTSVKPVN